MSEDRAERLDVPDRLGAAIQIIAAHLRAAGIVDSMHEARRLVGAVSGLGSIVVATEPERELDAAMRQALAEASWRRARREPLSRIVGQREFYGRPFLVTPATLDPRPDSETLVEAVLEVCREEGTLAAPLRILDVGVGTGCLLLTLLAELPHARGVGSDIATAALDTAKLNAEQLGLADRVRFVEARSLQGFDERFDIVVSNPPYIPRQDIAGLDAEVRDYDPIAALDGGADGLDIYRELAEGLGRVCRDGWVFFEVGAGQSDNVQTILAARYAERHPRPFRTWRDLGGHTRVVAQRQQGGAKS